MAEVQIHAGGSSPAPLTYTVASTEEFTLLAVNATFDGSGAGAAWLPAVEVVSDSGQVVARHITGVTVAAGGSAEATFAPFLRSLGAAAAGTAIEWATGIGEDMAVISGIDTKVSFDGATLLTNSPTLYTIDAGAGYTGLGIHEAGTYLTEYGVIFERVAGAQPPNPETIVAEADEGGNETTLGPFFGSNYGRGFVNVSAHDQWDVSWSKHIQIVSDTGGAPLVITVNQPSGQNLDCIVSFYVTRLPA